MNIWLSKKFIHVRSHTICQSLKRAVCSKEMLEKYDRSASKHVCDIVIGDESWTYAYKQQSTVWVFQDEPNPTKIAWERSTSKQMITCFFSEKRDMSQSYHWNDAEQSKKSEKPTAEDGSLFTTTMRALMDDFFLFPYIKKYNERFFNVWRSGWWVQNACVADILVRVAKVLWQLVQMHQKCILMGNILKNNKAIFND